MKLLIEQTGRSLNSIGSFSMLLFLFIFIYALLGMEFFAYRAIMNHEGDFIDPLTKEEDFEFPRENFNNIWNSMVTVYIMIQGEDWNVIMNTFVRVYEKT